MCVFLTFHISHVYKMVTPQIVHDAQQSLLRDLWQEQQAHCDRTHAEWDLIWEQAIQGVLPPHWLHTAHRARSVLETVCRLYVQALRGTHTLPMETLATRRDGIVALIHELRAEWRTELPHADTTDTPSPPPPPPQPRYLIMMQEQPLLRDTTALVLLDDPHAVVHIVGGDGRQLLFIPPCDVHATDQPPDLLFSADEYANYGAREELLIGAFADLHTNSSARHDAMTTVWHIGQDFGLAGASERPTDIGNPTVELLLQVQHTLLRRIFLSSPPNHAACLRNCLHKAGCIRRTHVDLHEALARCAPPSPLWWAPIPTAYTAYVVDLIVDALHRSGQAPAFPSRRTLPSCSPAPPTQAWPMWLRFQVSPPTTTEFLHGWSKPQLDRLRSVHGCCDPLFRAQVLTLPDSSE